MPEELSFINSNSSTNTGVLCKPSLAFCLADRSKEFIDNILGLGVVLLWVFVGIREEVGLLLAELNVEIASLAVLGLCMTVAGEFFGVFRFSRALSVAVGLVFPNSGFCAAGTTLVGVWVLISGFLVI